MDFAVFHPGEARGAMPNGTRVRKVNTAPGDTHPDGAMATVRSSLGPVELPRVGLNYGYFVEWDDVPGVPVFIAGTRVERVEESYDRA